MNQLTILNTIIDKIEKEGSFEIKNQHNQYFTINNFGYSKSYGGVVIYKDDYDWANCNLIAQYGIDWVFKNENFHK